MILEILLLPLAIFAFFALLLTPFALFLWLGLTINELAETHFFNRSKPVKYWITTILGWYFASSSALFMYALFYHILVFMGV